jgi:DHA1 family tetracycline resistance protein-like MFS transporter
MTDNAPRPTNPPRRAALIFIFVTVVLDVLSLGVTIPVLPGLIEEFVGGDTATAAKYYGLFGTAWALMQFLFAPVLGGLSDRFGRRSVILLSCIGLGLDYLLMALAPNLTWLFVGRVLSGILAASFATAGAYIADVVPPDKRAAGFGMIGAAWGLGFVLGPALGGVLGSIELRLPFWVAAALTLANALYGVFVLPESLPVERRRAFVWTRANPLGSLQLLRSQSQLLGFASVLFLYQLAHQVLSSVFVLYTGYRYDWSPRVVGLTLMAVGLLNVVVQGLIVRRLLPRWGEPRMLVLGLICGTLGFVGFALAPESRYFWAVMPVFALMGLFGPALQGLMTRRVTPDRQGELQGANSCLAGIAGMIGPGLFTGLFAWAISDQRSAEIPGLPFIVAGGLMLLGLLISWQTLRGTKLLVAHGNPQPPPAVRDG